MSAKNGMFVIMNERVGGPAFPDVSDCKALDENGEVVHLRTTQHGMSLQDWFAGQVLSSLLGVETTHVIRHRVETLAHLSYEIANAMLEERSKRAGKEQTELRAPQVEDKQ